MSPHAPELHPQSIAHEMSSSSPLHCPSPQTTQMPQSGTQLAHDSPTNGLHTPSPHCGPHGPQSSGQLLHDSPASGAHVPSPQPAQAPQSCTQLVHDSPWPGSHTVLPHVGHSPQSLLHVEHDSP
jgi:hypothetical protein